MAGIVHGPTQLWFHRPVAKQIFISMWYPLINPCHIILLPNGFVGKKARCIIYKLFCTLVMDVYEYIFSTT